ncbi:3-dehydroquinate synthase [Deltaproteobacteria bacterium]|nr:3-dehydroquinate synthase [Deltaproteobacteria bacterium]
MKQVFFKAVPYSKEEVALALESGVDGLIVPDGEVRSASGLARCRVMGVSDVKEIALSSREDEANAARLTAKGGNVLLSQGWEIIPVENLLAKASLAADAGMLALEIISPEEAALALGILERGVDYVVVPREAVQDIKEIVAAVKFACGRIDLQEAVITEIRLVGMGHRVCVDTLSLLTTGQGMLVGNSAAFTFLVNAETEHNEYVASRPFRINAGAVHAYAAMPGDKTAYLEELRAGREVLIVNHEGGTSPAVIGRIKVEKRPMLLIRAKLDEREGSVFLQNAETIRLVRSGGEAVSVVSLNVGDRILCRPDVAGRHFGMRIKEDITEN